MKQDFDEYDDNRTIADMSSVEGGLGRSLFGALGDLKRQHREKQKASGNQQSNKEGRDAVDRSAIEPERLDGTPTIFDPGESIPEEKPAYYVDEQMAPEDRRMYIFGAMGAAFAIGMVFLVAAFIVILIMVLVW